MSSDRNMAHLVAGMETEDIPPVAPGGQQTAIIDGRRINVLTWGDPADPPILLIHGLRDHARNWDWIAGALAARHYLIAPDLRGHGDSDWACSGAYGTAEYVLDLAEVVIALGLERFAIVGHSLGGVLGLRLAAAFPERVAAFAGVECIEMPIVRDEQKDPKPYPVRLRGWIGETRRRRSRQPRDYPTLADAVARMREEQPLLDAGTVEHLARHAVSANPDGSVRWKFDPAVFPRAPEDARGLDLDDILDAVRCPVLLAYGDASWIPVPATSRLGRLHEHRVVRYPGASHSLHHQCRADFLRDISTFLQSHYESQTHA